MSTHDVLIDVAAERLRQEGLKASGKFPATCADPIPDGAKLAILMEEVGEVARAINDRQSRDELRAELVQVAAVAVAWLEAMS